MRALWFTCREISEPPGKERVDATQAEIGDAHPTAQPTTHVCYKGPRTVGVETHINGEPPLLPPPDQKLAFDLQTCLSLLEISANRYER